jgi:hypothetical protein
VAATKAKLFERIRRDSWREGLSVRALARRHGCTGGNHFAAWQEPALFTTEVRAAFRSSR